MGGISYFIFLINPFLGLIQSLFSYSKTVTKNIIWFFVMLYGYTFVLYDEGMDAFTRKEIFELIIKERLDFHGTFSLFYLENQGGVDFLEYLLFYLVSRFSENFQILMLVLAVIFGFFYSRIISYLIEKDKNVNYLVGFLVLMLAFINGFWNINGFRFWGASIIFFYSTLPYVYEKNYKRLPLLIVVLLLHFTFLYPILIVLLYRILGDRMNLYFKLFLLSFLISFIPISVLSSVLKSVLPSAFSFKIEDYTNAKYVAKIASQDANWASLVKRFWLVLLNLYLYISYVYYRNKIQNDIFLSRLFSFSLLIMASANMFVNIPSGLRYSYNASFFVVSLMIFYFKKNHIIGYYKLYFKLVWPVFVLFMFSGFRDAMNTMNTQMLFGNTIMIMFSEYKLKSLIDLF